jgi:hypothetical protein
MTITFKCFISCLIETKIHHASTNVHKFINSLKYSYISINDGHRLMMMYDIHMHLNSFNIMINDDSKYIMTTFIITKKQYINYLCIEFIHVQLLQS